MHKKASILLLFLLALSPFVRAQSGDEARGVIMYDPLFWRSELRIKAAQARKIEEINRDFYQQLLTAYQAQPNDDSYLTGTVMEQTKVRNRRIMDTFLPHQRRKWQKIQVAYSN